MKIGRARRHQPLLRMRIAQRCVSHRARALTVLAAVSPLPSRSNALLLRRTHTLCWPRTPPTKTSTTPRDVTQRHAPSRRHTNRNHALQAPPRLAFKPLSEPSLEELLQASDATAVTVVKFQAPWDRSSLDSMSAEVERVLEQWPGASYYSVDLVRGSRFGERVFAEHTARLAERRPERSN